MKRVLLFGAIALVLALQSVASATVTAYWKTEAASSSLTRWTLHVDSTSGTIYGFDVQAVAPSGLTFNSTLPSAFSISTTTKGLTDSHFLLSQPTSGVANLLVQVQNKALNEDGDPVPLAALGGAFSIKQDGVYGAGFQSLDLLQVVLPKTNTIAPTLVRQATAGVALATVGTNAVQVPITVVPEPASLLLMSAAGAFFVRRRRSA